MEGNVITGLNKDSIVFDVWDSLTDKEKAEWLSADAESEAKNE